LPALPSLMIQPVRPRTDASSASFDDKSLMLRFKPQHVVWVEARAIILLKGATPDYGPPRN
jgi:hypothetical protein